MPKGVFGPPVITLVRHQQPRLEVNQASQPSFTFDDTDRRIPHAVRIQHGILKMWLSYTLRGVLGFIGGGL
jgi:hypothetical protein